MKQVIVDYIPFEVSPQQINEAIKENNGKLVVKGVSVSYTHLTLPTNA